VPENRVCALVRAVGRSFHHRLVSSRFFFFLFVIFFPVFLFFIFFLLVLGAPRASLNT